MLDSKYRGRRIGVSVREGAVRQARKEAGLSLAQVARYRHNDMADLERVLSQIGPRQSIGDVGGEKPDL